MIYVPPAVISGTAHHGRWVTLEEVEWEEGEARLPQTKYCLNNAYGALESFFVDHIQVVPSETTVILKELRAFISEHEHNPLDDAAHQHIHTVLGGLSRVWCSSERSPLWLHTLYGLQCLPVRDTKGVVRLERVHPTRFFPDPSDELAALFRNDFESISKSGG